MRASKLDLRIVPTIEERDFLDKYHYQGYIPSKVCYGLYYNNELIELMSFGKPRFNKRYDWELLRLCSKKDTFVYGGASRLFKHFCEDEVGSIMSYCNETLFTGNVYSKLGFTKLGSCKSYHYEKDGKSYHRINFQKWKLIEEGFDPNKTEKEIMVERGYDIVEETQATWVYGVKWYIYKITNKLNGKTYIGQHLDRGDDYWGSGTNIKRAIAKYGKESFIKEIIIDNISSQEEADKLELKEITANKLLGKAEYNILVTKTPPHTSLRNNGKHWKATEEQIQCNRESHLGQIPWNKGKSGYHNNKERSQESKDKASATMKLLFELEPERSAKISERMKGNKNARSYSKWLCIETGEIKSSKEWAELGYKVHRHSYKGKHFKNMR